MLTEQVAQVGQSQAKLEHRGEEEHEEVEDGDQEIEEAGLQQRRRVRLARVQGADDTVVLLKATLE